MYEIDIKSLREQIEKLIVENNGLKDDKAKLQDANLSGSDLREATLDSAVFNGTNLSDARLEGAFAFNTRFSGVTIDGADFTDVPLRGDALNTLCAVADGTNSVTGRNTRDTLGCP